MRHHWVGCTFGLFHNSTARV